MTAAGPADGSARWVRPAARPAARPEREEQLMADEPRGGNPPPAPGQEASPQKGSSGRRAGRDRLPKVTPEEFLAVIRSLSSGDSPPAARENKWGLPHLGEGYGLVARSEGKSNNTIAIVTASVRYLTRYLQDSGASLDIRHIDTAQLRGFIVHLQGRTRFAVHPLTPPQAEKLSGHTINAYLDQFPGGRSVVGKEISIQVLILHL